MNKYKGMLFFEADGGGGSGGGDGSGGSLIAGGDPPQQQQQPEGYFNSEGGFAEGWLDRLPEDFLPEEDRDAFRVHASKYKSPLDAIKSDYNKEKLIGRKSIGIPNEKSTPEEIAAYRKAVGAPESADGYQLKPNQLPEGVDWNDDIAKPFAAIAHKYHIPQAAMSELVAAQLAMEGSRASSAVQAAQADLASGREELKKAFGSDFDASILLAQRAAATAGVDPRSIGFNDPAVVKGFVHLAKLLSEDKLNAVPGAGGVHQGGANKAKDIMTNPSNPLHEKYRSGDEETVALVRSYLKQG